MGVYIKGMVMPYGCANCHFVSEPIYDAKGRATYVCNVPVEEVRGKGNTDEVIALYEGALEAFPDWCPLVEVPEPHGRLVDADKLIMHLADYQLQESPVWGSNEYGNADKYEAITDCIDAVESACAVIEAEGEYKCE